MSESSKFGLIVNDEFQFMVWPTQRRLPSGWRFTGRTGTAAELDVMFLLHFVQGPAATHIAPDTLFSASQWEDTASGARLVS